jgi:hypothetical protein
LSWLFWSCRLSCSFSLLPLGGGLGWLCVKGVFWRSIDFCLVSCMYGGGRRRIVTIDRFAGWPPTHQSSL